MRERALEKGFSIESVIKIQRDVFNRQRNLHGLKQYCYGIKSMQEPKGKVEISTRRKNEERKSEIDVIQKPMLGRPRMETERSTKEPLNLAR